MPRYFFDMNDGDKQGADMLGVELDDAPAPRNGAIVILPDVPREELPNGDQDGASA